MAEVAPALWDYLGGAWACPTEDVSHRKRTASVRIVASISRRPPSGRGGRWSTATGVGLGAPSAWVVRRTATRPLSLFESFLERLINPAATGSCC